MFINDVGETTWEEINDGIAGSNYGWPNCIADRVPDPEHERDPGRRDAMERALRYMALAPGMRLQDVKIDRAFISHMDSDAESHKIVQVIIMLAQAMGLVTVAEGAETEDRQR